MSDGKIWVVEKKFTGEQSRGYTLDPKIHGFDGFDFDPEVYEVVTYVPQQASIPTAVVQDIENRLRMFARNIERDMERKYLMRLADMIDQAVLEHSK